MSEIKAIGFDWGGVLNGRPGKFFGQSVATLLGISYQQYLDAYFKHNKKVNRGEVTWEELWTLVLTDLGKRDKVHAIMKLSQEANAERLNQDVLDLADKLRALGYKIGLLSNNTHEKAASMRQTGLDKHFDVFHISAETGLVKPEPHAFTHFSEELGVKPSELVFIDDSEKSLSTATEVGFTSILFDTYEELIQDLTNLKII